MGPPDSVNSFPILTGQFQKMNHQMKSLLLIILSLTTTANAEETMKPRPTFACVKLNGAPVAIFATRNEAEKFISANTTNGHAKGSLGTKFEIDQNQDNTMCSELWHRMETARIEKELNNKGHK